MTMMILDEKNINDYLSQNNFHQSSPQRRSFFGGSPFFPPLGDHSRANVLLLLGALAALASLWHPSVFSSKLKVTNIENHSFQNHLAFIIQFPQSIT